ncbi:MAG: IS200/IS605 family transposase [Verrucomicrobiota bacterium]
MPQSLSAVYVHGVFSTKERRPFFRDPGFRHAVHGYLGAISQRLECGPARVGGVEDHVHILARLARTISQAEWVKELKRASSLWIKEQQANSPSIEGPGSSLKEFAWQGGYACFSVSVSNLETVEDYIRRQEEHHRKRSFQDELRRMLEKHGEAWDERYLWD